MNKIEKDELEKSLKEIDMGISAQDSAMEKFAKKLFRGIVAKCLKDRSGAAFYKVADTIMGIVPGEGHADLLDLIENGAYCNNAATLKQVYKCLGKVLSNHPECLDRIVTCTLLRSRQKENDGDCVKNVFKLCDRIGVMQPDYIADLNGIKQRCLKNLCLESPEKALAVISSVLADTYPSKNDLDMIYDGFLTMLANSALKKEAYEPMVILLKDCARSGHNQGENALKIGQICSEIERRNPSLQREIVAVKQILVKNRISPDRSKNCQDFPKPDVGQFPKKESKEY